MTLADKINAALDAKKTVTIATYLRVIPVKARHREAWAKAGVEFFKTDAKGATWMIAGMKNGNPRYECIDGTKVTAA